MRKARSRRERPLKSCRAVGSGERGGKTSRISEQRIYRDGARIQSLAGFFRLQDVSYHATGHPPRKVRVTGYLLWDDDHNGSADVGSTIQYFSKNGFHHPWRSTAWEIHPVMKMEVIQ
jgi:hypothetical protein